MIWNHPAVFLTFLAFPPLLYLIVRTMKRRRQKLEKTFSNDMRVLVLGGGSRSVLIVKYSFLFAALLAFLCVFAGPRFGKVEESHKVFGRDVFILFDVSDSMLAEDVSPNRLTLARLDVEDFLDAAVGDRIGLVAFAGSAQVEIPLTTDYEFFRELLRKVDTKTVRLGGTATGDAIRLALKRFGEEPDRKRLIILITDGEDHESLPLEAAKNAAEMNVPIIAIGIGSPDGAKIPVFNVYGERTGYKTFDGQEAVSKTDVETLKEIARISKGRYFYADSTLNLADVYKTSVDIQGRNEIADESRVALKDRYQPFLAFGLFAFMLYHFCPTRIPSFKRRETVLLALFALAFIFPPTSKTYADSQDKNAAEVATEPRPKSKNQEIKAYNQSLRLVESDVARFAELQKALTRAKNPDVSSRANFNLAALELKKALDSAQSLINVDNLVPEKEIESIDNKLQEGKSQEILKDSEDRVVKYDNARRERERERSLVSSLADDASTKFFDAQENPKLGRQSNQNAEIASNWRDKFDERERAAETKLRAEVLSNPKDHLRWLERELDETIGSVQSANPQMASTGFYRSLSEKKSKISTFKNDVISIVAKISKELTNPTDVRSSTPGFTNATSQPSSSLLEPDDEGVKIITQASNLFDAHAVAAAEKLSQYGANSAREELRLAQTQLTTFHDVPARYDALVVGLSEKETTLSDDLTSDSIDLSDVDQRDNLRWSREALRLSVDETMRKAKQIVKSFPEDMDAPQKETAIPQQTKWDDSFDSQTGDPVFDSNDPSETPSLNRRSYEERARESATVALKHEQELRDSVENAVSILSHNLDKQQFIKTQIKITEIINEIAKPFKDTDQQNQNQNQNKNQDQNQNQQNQDLNRQNQDHDQNSNDQNQKKSDDSRQRQDVDRNNSEDEKVPDELDQPQQEKKEQSNSQDKVDDQNKKTQVEIASSNQDRKKAKEQRQKTEEQKDADAIMRRVFRRQKDAEPQREAVRQALKKKEKSGKDW